MAATTMSDLPRFELRFEDPDALSRGIEADLGRGRAFVRGVTGLETFSRCVLALVHPEDGRVLELDAEVVLPPEQQEQLGGVGLEVRARGDALLAFLSGDDRPAHDLAGHEGGKTSPSGDGDAAAAGPGDAEEVGFEGASEAGLDDAEQVGFEGAGEAALGDAEDAGLEGGRALAFDDPNELAFTEDERALAEDGAVLDRVGEGAYAEDAALLDDEGFAEDEAAGDPLGAEAVARRLARNAIERVRHLDLAGQLRVARGGVVADRVALERLFGRNVWEALLTNPRITVAEVAKIGRKGSVPRPLLDLVVGNAGWLRAGIVRRALLANPRLSREGTEKVLRMTPRAELRAIEKQAAYPPAVRELARKILAR